MLIAPTEPGQLHAIGTTSSTPEQFGADILVPAAGFLIGVQRKVFPDDFLGSLDDGRMGTLAIKMQRLPMRVLVLEGIPRWTPSGQLVGHDFGQGSRFTRAHLRGLLWSLQYEFGIVHYWTDDITDTITFLRDLQRWGRKPDHLSLLDRPGLVTKRIRKSERDWGVYLLQGFDGWGPKRAGDVYDHFGRVPLEFSVSDEELLEVPGVGKGTIEKAKKVLR